jgi:hypothetical protein
VNDIACKCEIRPAGRFHGWNDYDEFAQALKDNPLFVPVTVTKPYSNVGLVEQWYQCMACQSVWRLVEPDPPFNGLWEKVEVES